MEATISGLYWDYTKFCKYPNPKREHVEQCTKNPKRRRKGLLLGVQVEALTHMFECDSARTVYYSGWV